MARLPVTPEEVAAYDASQAAATGEGLVVYSRPRAGHDLAYWLAKPGGAVDLGADPVVVLGKLGADRFLLRGGQRDHGFTRRKAPNYLDSQVSRRVGVGDP